MSTMRNLLKFVKVLTYFNTMWHTLTCPGVLHIVKVLTCFDMLLNFVQLCEHVSNFQHVVAWSAFPLL